MGAKDSSSHRVDAFANDTADSSPLPAQPGEQALQRVNKAFVEDLTDGLFSTLIDTTLYWLLFLPMASVGKRGSVLQAYRIVEEAYDLQKALNYEKFNNAYRKLKDKGLIHSVKDWADKKIATKEGMKRLNSAIPHYDEKRYWDGRLYVIIYDIPVHQNAYRDKFRSWFLKKLRAVQLQDSSYVLFYNPQELVKSFVAELGDFEGNILISRLGKSGFLSGLDLKDFLWKQSGLDMVNLEYRQFLKEYGPRPKPQRRAKALLLYLKILHKDPQLPFQLMPKKYLGDKAYLLFLKYTKKTPINTHVRGR